MTFSIVARCAASGQFGVGAATAMPAVGKLLSYAFPRKGAVATQATLNPYLGIDGIALLRRDLPAEEVLGVLRRGDPKAELRQFAVVDGAGRTAAWTGQECLGWAGSLSGAGYSLQGNRLVGAHVLEAAARAFETASRSPLADRLLAALEAGASAGGDAKGERSGNILIVGTEEYPLWDIRVDDHDDPIAELHRLHALFKRQLLPEIEKMPTRANPAGEAGESAA